MNIFVDFSAYFAAPFLAELLDAKLFVINTNFNNFFGDNTKKGVFCGKNTENINNDDLIVIGYNALYKIRHRIEQNEFNSVKFIVCDSKSCEEYAWWNEFVKKNGVELYIMPDIKDYSKCDFTPIYQYIKVPKDILKMKKNDKLTISHSPRSQIKKSVKGTNEIVEIINGLKKEFDFNFDLITGVSQIECIKRKAKSHIFIDQLILNNKNIPQYRFGGKIKYKGGLGKSGLEAMILNCATIVGGVGEELDFAPPIIWTDYYKMESELKKLIKDESNIKDIVDKQKNWISNYYKKENYMELLNLN